MPVITPLVLTRNEAPNISRTLAMLAWAGEALVVDSFSTDDTVALARQFPRTRVLQRPFDTHSIQWNYGVSEARTEWVLTLDADYVLSDELVRELQHWQPEEGVVAYHVAIRYCIGGRPLRGSLYPPRPVLFHRGFCRYEQDGHTQELVIKGRAEQLQGVIFHDDRKSVSCFIQSQDRYARLEAKKLLSAKREELSVQDRIRLRIVIAPFLVFFYTLFGKGLILDGWRGWYYVFQRVLAEVVLALHLLEAKWRQVGGAEKPET